MSEGQSYFLKRFEMSMQIILNKNIYWIAGVFLIGFLSGVFFLDMLYRTPHGKTGQTRTVTIPPGTPLSAISDSLVKHDIIRNRQTFELALQLRGLETSVQPGIFRIPVGADYRSLIEILTGRKTEVVKVTVIEGLQARQIAGLLAKNFRFTSNEFMALVEDPAFAEELGVPGPSLEGFLFPDTYKFFINQSPRTIAGDMVRHFFSVVPDSFTAQARELGWTMWEAVTLASIIEGEAVYDEERQTIASVYHNRLDEGMRLQADPTIQYIIEDGPRRLYEKDLEIDSPYNTYRNAGLPPGPINNPGLESIHAALYPAETEYLYFVATGNGYHTFSRTNREHINAKRRLQQLRREVAREREEQREDDSP